MFSVKFNDTIWVIIFVFALIGIVVALHFFVTNNKLDNNMKSKNCYEQIIIFVFFFEHNAGTWQYNTIVCKQFETSTSIVNCDINSENRWTAFVQKIEWMMVRVLSNWQFIPVYCDASISQTCAKLKWRFK